MTAAYSTTLVAVAQLIKSPFLTKLRINVSSEKQNILLR